MIHLSRTTRYAGIAVAYLAQHSNGKMLVGHQLAKATGVPEGFVLRLMVALARANILRSIKGPNGGYCLARSPADISLLDITEAVEGKFRAPLSERNQDVVARMEAAYAEAAELARKQLAKVTVADLVGRRSAAKARR